MRGAAATQAMSAFHLPNQTLMISGITKRKWNDIVLLKRSVFNRIETIHLRFGRNFDSSLAKWDWKRKFLEVEREVSVGLNHRPKEPPLEVDHFHRKISTHTKASNLFFDQNFRKFWYNGKHPLLFLMAKRGSLSGGAFLHTVGYYKECAYRFI